MADDPEAHEIIMHIKGDTGGSDAACKRLLCRKDILSWILTLSLPEFEDRDPKWVAAHCIAGNPVVDQMRMSPEDALDAVASMDREDTTMDEGVVRYDVRVTVLDPKAVDEMLAQSDGNARTAKARPRERIEIIVNLEAQGSTHPGYPIIMRAEVYACRQVASQYEGGYKGSHYERVRKVYSIWICSDAPAYKQNTVWRYHVVGTPVHLNGKPENPGPAEHYELMNFVMIYLGKPAEVRECKGLEMLDVLFSQMDTEKKLDVLHKEYDIELSKDLREDVEQLSDFWRGFWRQGYDQRAEEDAQLVEDAQQKAATAEQKAATAEQDIQTLKAQLWRWG